MATTTTIQQSQPMKKPISPEQEGLRLKEAQDLLMRLQWLIREGDKSPGLEIMAEAIMKFEELVSQSALQPHLDLDTRKTLEDISALLLSARQMAKEKGLDERLEKIVQESKRALKNMSPMEQAPQEMTEFLDFMNTWRPLFYLLLSSKDFRVLIIDSIRITKRIVYSYTDNLSFFDETTYHNIEGISLKQRIKEEIKQKEMPQLTDEEWNKIQIDLQRVLIFLAREPNFREGMERIFNLLDMFQYNILQDVPNTTSLPVPSDIHVQKIMNETEIIVSSFSGRETLEQFKFHLGNLVRKSRTDHNFHAYLHELKLFLLKTKSEEQIRSEEFREKSKEMARRARELMHRFKEDDDLRPFLDSANLMLDNIKNDEFLRILRHQAGIVQADLSYVDNEGKLQLDTDMLTKLQTVLLPDLVDALKYIPVPRIQSSDQYRDFCLDKIVLCSYDIIPENIRFHLETDSEFSFQDNQIRETHTFLVIQLNQLRTELKDVEFFYKKKTFPTLEDSGRVTFRIKGDGARLTLTYKIIQNPGEPSPKMSQGYANFDISDLDIEFDTNTIKHSVLIPMLTNLFKIQIKEQMEEIVERNLKSWINKLGDLMSKTLAQLNRPLLSGLEAARKTLKTTPLAELYQMRREKLE